MQKMQLNLTNKPLKTFKKTLGNKLLIIRSNMERVKLAKKDKRFLIGLIY
jgi:hypothetical protein